MDVKKGGVMKKVIGIYVSVVAVVLVVFVGCATTPQAVGEPMLVQRVIEAGGTQDDLYRMANEWMAKTFVASSEVIQYQDKEEGVIVGRGLTDQKFGWATADIWYNMKVEVKQNRARVTIDTVYGELTVIDETSTLQSKDFGQKEYDELKAKFNTMIDDFSAYMKQESEEW